VTEQEPVELQLRVDWSQADHVPTQLASQFLVQVAIPVGQSPDGVVIAVGHLDPAVLIGSDEDRRQQAERYEGRLPVQVHGRYYLTRSRLEELRNALNELASKYDELEYQAQERA